MKNRNTVLLILLLLLGVGILIYPVVSNFVNKLHGSYAIEAFQTRIENADVTAERKKAEEYNEKIRSTVMPDTFSGEVDHTGEEYNDTLDFGGGMMGYLQIPKIHVNLPIYHGTDEDTLAKGVGHLPQSALPIGGKGNHTVLTGHTGLPSAEMFNDLTELENGDKFSIHVLNEILVYQVDQIKVVLPSEGQDLVSVPAEDYCTLVTCTPYGINTHRLLVRGYRILPGETDNTATNVIPAKQSYLYLWVISVALILLTVVIIFVIKQDISSYQ